MHKQNIIFKLIFILFLIDTVNLNAQALATGTPLLEDYYRREQLLGNISPNISFVSYPLFPLEAFQQKNSFYTDTSFLEYKNIDGNLDFTKSLILRINLTAYQTL